MAEPIKPTVVQLIASTGFYGGENVVANICKMIGGEQMVVLCLTRNSRQTSSFKRTVEGAGAHFITRKHSLWTVLTTLGEIHKESQALCIHAHGYKETFIACLFALYHNCRVIVTQHGFTSRNQKSKLYNYINKACCRWGKVDKVIAVSRGIYSIYENFGVQKKKLHYFANGILPVNPTAGKRLESKEKLLRMFNLREKKNIILYAGRFSAEKDPLLFLEVFNQLHAKAPASYAIMAGDGPLKQQVEERIHELGLQSRIALPGFVQNMESLLLGSDILLLTSTTEGVPMVVLEAMTCGTVVVAAEVGDIAEMLEHGESGVVVNSRAPQTYADHCLQILSDSDLKYRLMENGKKTIEQRYDNRRHKEFYQQLYGMEVSI